MRERLRLPRCDRREALLRGHAVSGLCGVCGRVVDPRRTDHHHLARAVRGDHRPDSRDWLLRRSERRDWRHLRMADQAARRLRGAARVVKSARPVRVKAASPIKHVVIIVKENHGYDNYFGRVPGGEGVRLPAGPNPPSRDPDHRHPAWLERDTTAPRVSFARHDIPHYWGYAQQYTLCDNYFTDVAGPSTPNHLMLIMADSALIDNPKTNYRMSPGPPIYDQPSLPEKLDQAGLSWGNYNGYAFEYIRYTSGKMKTWQQFSIDVAAGKLPSVSWLYSGGRLSEHPADPTTPLGEGQGVVRKGRLWTGGEVQAVVSAGLWPQAAIFITWDDWGGWWDHGTPPEVEKWTDGTQFRYGGRGGGLGLSPYRRGGLWSQGAHPPGSLFKF